MKMQAHPSDWPLCPQCGEAFEPNTVHPCPTFRDQAIARVDRWLVWVVVWVFAVYFGAHVLVAAGVACP